MGAVPDRLRMLCPLTVKGHGGLQSRGPKFFRDLHRPADAARIETGLSSLLDEFGQPG